MKMKSGFLLGVFLCCIIFYAELYAEKPNMFLYETEAGYTYVDKNFNPLMKKTFNFAGRFFEGLAVAAENGYVGYINTKGDFVIKPEFEYALPFHYGVAKVWKDGKSYLINKKGRILFEHNYRFIKYAVKNSFEPIFIVTTEKGWKQGIVDKTGKVIVDTVYDDIHEFSEGLAVVYKDNKWGVIDMKGNVVVPFGKYFEIVDYNSSRAVVISREWNNNTIGYIDKQGNLVFKEKDVDYYPIRQRSFLDGLVAFRIKDSNNNHYYKLKDTTGNNIYVSKDYIRLLKGGYAVVRHKADNNYCILNKEGKFVVHGVDKILVEKEKSIPTDNLQDMLQNLKNKDRENIFTIGWDGVIKDTKGNVVNKENVFIVDVDYYDKMFFINNKLVITGRKAGSYSNWFAPNSYNEYNPPAQFSFIDPEGFKDGLLFVIFYDGSYSDLCWGYLNEKGEEIYRNYNTAFFNKGIKLNINYKEERGLFNCIDSNNNLEQPMNPNKITLLLDTNVYEKKFEWGLYKKKLCHRLRIINEKQDTFCLQGSFYEQISVQAKDKNGIWRNIQTYIPTDVISDEIYKLAPNKFWEFAVQSYSGGFRTKMRVVLKRDAVYDWESRTTLFQEEEFISNEIDCEINASQFVRSQFTKNSTEGYPFEDYLFDRVVSIP